MLDLAPVLGERLEPYQRRIARAFFGDARLIAALLPRGNFKTSLAAIIGLHELLTGENPSITVGAASQSQARICFERMVGFIQGSELDELVKEGRLEIRHLELRLREGERVVGRHGSEPVLTGLPCMSAATPLLR